MLAAIAHAVMTALYPDLSIEHSWDGISYNVQDGAGTRGTITFHDVVTVAAFRNECSSRLHNGDLTQTVQKSLLNTPPAVHEVAVSETLQYLLDEVEGQTIPLITSLFYGVKDDFESNDKIEDLLKHCVDIIETQRLGCTDEAFKSWQDYYEMTQAQSDLVLSLYQRKVLNPEIEIILTHEETNHIGMEKAEGIEECRESLAELGIISPA